MNDDRRHDDLRMEGRVSVLEEQNRMAMAWRIELERKVDLSNAKMDLMLEAVHMAKGGWWAAGKIIGLVLGIISGIGMVVGAFWWAYQHITIKPAVAMLAFISVGILL